MADFWLPHWRDFNKKNKNPLFQIWQVKSLLFVRLTMIKPDVTSFTRQPTRVTIILSNIMLNTIKLSKNEHDSNHHDPWVLYDYYSLIFCSYVINRDQNIRFHLLAKYNKESVSTNFHYIIIIFICNFCLRLLT